jgi:hypothetical protein
MLLLEPRLLLVPGSDVVAGSGSGGNRSAAVESPESVVVVCSRRSDLYKLEYLQRRTSSAIDL